MELPILSKLKDGEKFDFQTLADSIEQTEQFWEWWWEERANPKKFSRPELIEDDDPVLEETSRKLRVNLCHYSELFDKFLNGALKDESLPAHDGFDRDGFRNLLVRRISCGVRSSEDRPQIVFSGGGYGSGKTSVMNFLSVGERPFLPVSMSSTIGVDIFKPLIPEYNLIKAVADGRASLTVQKECRMLASMIFDRLVETKRSFIWDSSMSDYEDTSERIATAKEAGYELTMVAVLTPPEEAIRLAMSRAKKSRRFPHPDALPKSHAGFRANFEKYHPHFDSVYVFSNDGRSGIENCSFIAEKSENTKVLAIHDEKLFLDSFRAQ